MQTHTQTHISIEHSNTSHTDFCISCPVAGDVDVEKSVVDAFLVAEASRDEWTVQFCSVTIKRISSKYCLILIITQ